MDCRITSIKPRAGDRRVAGFTLAESMVAVGLGGLALAVICWLLLYGNRAFASMANYLDLDLKSEQTLDQMSREIREADHLTSYASNDIQFVSNSGATVEYQYSANAQTLLRISGGVTNTYLSGCSSLSFSIYQRTPISNTFEPYSTTTYANAKLVEINWNCSRNIMAAKANTESVQSAKVVIRNH